MLRKNQQGFSHVLLFILVIVVFVGLTVGFAFLKNKRDNNSAAKKNDTGAYVDDGKSIDDRDAGKNFMTISEWGIKIPINGKTGLLYYASVPIAENSPVEYVRVFSTDIDELQNADGDFCSDDDFPIVTLAKTTKEKMDSVSDPDSADYAGPSGQFRSFSFDTTYAYSALGYYQAPPVCSELIAKEEGGERETDDAVLRVYEEKKAAIIESFNKAQKDQ